MRGPDWSSGRPIPGLIFVEVKSDVPPGTVDAPSEALGERGGGRWATAVACAPTSDEGQGLLTEEHISYRADGNPGSASVSGVFIETRAPPGTRSRAAIGDPGGQGGVSSECVDAAPRTAARHAERWRHEGYLSASSTPEMRGRRRERAGPELGSMVSRCSDEPRR